jgi:hypothetical protein
MAMLKTGEPQASVIAEMTRIAEKIESRYRQSKLRPFKHQQIVPEALSSLSIKKWSHRSH